MGSGNTKIGVQHETEVDLRIHKGSKFTSTDVVEATATNIIGQRAGRESTATQKPMEEKKTEQPDKILAKHSLNNPKLERILKKSLEAFQGLKKCLLSDTLLETDSSEGAIRYGVIFTETMGDAFDLDLELNVQTFKTKHGDFLTALGFPKLTYDIFASWRSRFPEITPEKEKESAEGYKKEVKEAQDRCQSTLSNVLLKYTSFHGDFCVACGEAGLVAFLADTLSENQDCDQEQERMFDNFFKTVYNLSRCSPCRVYFTNCHAVEKLLPFLKAEAPYYSTLGLLTVAQLIDEKNNELIMSNDKTIECLVDILEKRVDFGLFTNDFSIVELVEGLGKIASNDSNKRKIGETDAIPLLVSLIQRTNIEEEKSVAAETLWTLAFDEENKKTIRENEEVMSVLKELQQSHDSRTRKAAAGVLWELQGKELHSEGKPETVSSQHIMISYQWDVQDVVLQIRDKLKSLGFKVWVDVDEMAGSTLESMAKAVENAAVVLMCLSQKYKDSPNCRSEAEYTFQLRRDVIPLMMESNFKPDGWLGMIVGAKLWMDFREKFKTSSGLEKLVKELKDRGKKDLQEQPKQVTSAVVDGSSNRPDIISWTQEDVTKWLAELGLKKISNKAKKRLNGKLLILLNNLRQESPDFYYASLQRDFNLADVFDVLLFTDALNQLVG